METRLYFVVSCQDLVDFSFTSHQFTEIPNRINSIFKATCQCSLKDCVQWNYMKTVNTK